VLAVLDGKPAASEAPKRKGGKGRVWEYIGAGEAKALRAAVLRHVDEKYASVSDFLSRAMGLGKTSMSHTYRLIQGDDPITVQAAARLRAALDGKPPPAKPVDLRRRPAPSSDLVLAPRDEKAGPNILAGLRERTGKALVERFGGDIPTLANAIGLTAERLVKFLKGGSLRLKESAEVSERLGPEPRSAAMMEAPGFTLRATLEAFRNGGASHDAESIAPPELRARKLVEKWGTEAMNLVFELAKMGGAA